MIKKIAFQFVLVAVCCVLSGCKVKRAYRGYVIIDTGSENYVLHNSRNDFVVGPKIAQWGVWKEYIFLYKLARPGDFSGEPYTDQSGYIIVKATNGGVQFFENRVQFETEVKKLGAPEERLILHKLPGAWRPSKEDSESTDTAAPPPPIPVFFPHENPAAAKP